MSCSGVQSGVHQIKTELATTMANFTSLTSGDEYDVSVTAYFTNDIGEMYYGTETKRQAIGKTLHLLIELACFSHMLSRKALTIF